MKRTTGIRFAAILLILLNLGSLACGYSSRQRGEQAANHDGAFNHGDSDMHDASSFASTEPADPQRAAETAMVAFELALQQLCLCTRSNDCEAAWIHQFEQSFSRDCVVEILARDIDVANCVATSAEKINQCIQAKGCPSYRSCDLASLTEDTPLVDLVGNYCSEEVYQSYNSAMLAEDDRHLR